MRLFLNHLAVPPVKARGAWGVSGAATPDRTQKPRHDPHRHAGWSYPSWRGPFFPREVMVKHHLAYYATQFSTAELNGMFYRTPSFEAVRGWREQTPKDFVFARTAGAPWIATARDVYVCGRVPRGDYKDHYSQAMPREWARKISVAAGRPNDSRLF